MDNKDVLLKKELKRIKNDMMLKKALNSYVEYIVDFLSSNIEYFYEFCELYGLSEEEMLNSLRNPSNEYITAYDHMASLIGDIKSEDKRERTK